MISNGWCFRFYTFYRRDSVMQNIPPPHSSGYCPEIPRKLCCVTTYTWVCKSQPVFFVIQAEKSHQEKFKFKCCQITLFFLLNNTIGAVPNTLQVWMKYKVGNCCGTHILPEANSMPAFSLPQSRLHSSQGEVAIFHFKHLLPWRLGN